MLLPAPLADERVGVLPGSMRKFRLRRRRDGICITKYYILKINTAF
jgi:hypothetical protein